MQPSRHARARSAQAALTRAALALRPGRLEPGVTVLVAYYRTPDLIRTCLDRVLLHSSNELRRVIVVDNASGDGVAETLASDVVDAYALPVNVGHGWALDWASWQVETEHFVSLDSDAWPVADGWLERLTAPLAGGAACAGIYHHRHYVHPACLAISTRTFRRLRLSFLERLPPAPSEAHLLGRTYWDVGERISMELLRRGHDLHLLPADQPEDRERKMVGTTYGGAVYHLWYGSRLGVEDRERFDGVPRELIEAELKARTRAPAER